MLCSGCALHMGVCYACLTIHANEIKTDVGCNRSIEILST